MYLEQPCLARSIQSENQLTNRCRMLANRYWQSEAVRAEFSKSWHECPQYLPARSTPVRLLKGSASSEDTHLQEGRQNAREDSPSNHHPLLEKAASPHKLPHPELAAPTAWLLGKISFARTITNPPAVDLLRPTGRCGLSRSGAKRIPSPRIPVAPTMRVFAAAL